MSLLDRVMNTLRRRETRDAFTDDEGFDDFEEEDDAVDPDKMPLGRKIAIGMSGLLFVLLAGGGGAIWYLGKDAPPPPMAMAAIADLKIEEEPATPAPTAPAAAPTAPVAAPTAAKPGAAPAPAAPAPAANAVAATERSTDRRPWLTNPGAQPPAAAKPGAPAPVVAITPPPPAPAQMAKAMPPPPPPATAAKPEPPKAEPAKVEAAKAAPAKAEPVPEPTKAEPVQAAEAEMPTVIGEAAPGAPERFVADGVANAGGRPRLNEPSLPPTDRKTVSAAPPRFGNISDLKAKVVAYTKTPADPKKQSNGKIAVVVRGLGLSQAATEAAVTKLPPAVTLSFNPYAQNLKKWLDAAKARGHEVLVEVPMESKSFPAEDPGPLGLMTSLDAKKNLERMDAILKAVPGAIGIDDSMGSKFRESETNMNNVFAKLREKKLIYVQTEPGVQIGEPGVPHTVADVVADERPFRASIDARLDYAERLAKFQGSAVTVIEPKPVSFERLAVWIETLNGKGIALAPVSEVLVR